jgi:hypothetical protein
MPTIWHIQEGTNLTQNELITLKKQGFPLTTSIEAKFKVYLAPNLHVQVIPMCLLQ